MQTSKAPCIKLMASFTWSLHCAISSLTYTWKKNASKAQLKFWLIGWSDAEPRFAMGCSWCFVQDHGSFRMNRALSDEVKGISQAATWNAVLGFVWPRSWHCSQQTLQLGSRTPASPPHLICQVWQALPLSLSRFWMCVQWREKMWLCFLMAK